MTWADVFFHWAKDSNQPHLALQTPPDDTHDSSAIEGQTKCTLPSMTARRTTDKDDIWAWRSSGASFWLHHVRTDPRAWEHWPFVLWRTHQSHKRLFTTATLSEKPLALLLLIETVLESSLWSEDAWWRLSVKNWRWNYLFQHCQSCSKDSPGKGLFLDLGVFYPLLFSWAGQKHLMIIKHHNRSQLYKLVSHGMKNFYRGSYLWEFTKRNWEIKQEKDVEWVT